tara:strand:+ start:797 stop:2725 length:1929 start_codon:yes stop_codon:yes gene_type:complete
MKEEVIQMVDDDEIENVGIMSGFMDELEDLISEIDAEDLEKNKGGDEADTAKLMGRTPNSPEILMNNLRGDMRSVDARREELADLVGMREAEDTPEGVLTLLQSVLAQQEAAPPMPPQGMPPEMMGGMPPMLPQGMPPEMMGGMPPMPPQGMAPPPMGIESVMPDMSGMYRGGPVQNFNQGSGAMGVTPANDAFAAYPSDVVEEAQRRVRHMVDGGMVQNYNQGGVVQHFQDGSEEAVSPAGRYSPKAVSGANAYIQQLLAQRPSAANIDLETAMGEEAALYETLGLGTDPKDAQAQMLFDIGQAAFGYAGNVGADGNPMQGSAAARLSQALGPLAGKVGARAGQMSKEGQALKMLALKGAQGKLAAAQASDTALAARQGDLAMEIAKQEPAARMLTEAEIAAIPTLTPGLPWQQKANSEYSVAGGRPPAIIPPTIVDPYWSKGREGKLESDDTLVTQAQAGKSNLAKLNNLLKIIDEGDINVGILADMTSGMNKLKATLLNDPEALSIEAQNNYTDMMLGSDVFPLINSLGIGARGLDTPAERDFLISVMTGSRKMGKEALMALTQFRINREIDIMNSYNQSVADGSLDDYFDLGYTKETFEVPDREEINLTTVAQVRSIEEAKIEARIAEEIAKREAEKI